MITDLTPYKEQLDQLDLNKRAGIEKDCRGIEPGQSSRLLAKALPDPVFK